MLISLTVIFPKNQHTTKHILFEIMQEVRRMKTSPLTTEEIERIEEVVIFGLQPIFCSLLDWYLLTFSLFYMVDAGAQEIQK